jgi:hypothetical protein
MQSLAQQTAQLVDKLVVYLNQIPATIPKLAEILKTEDHKQPRRLIALAKQHSNEDIDKTVLALQSN